MRPTSSSLSSSATASGDVPFTYTWAFGDGAYGSGPAVPHTYGLPGPYTVVLTVTNCG
ncbi:MAG: PKD domain-containing protein, partial [Chloroflexia bacterium]